MQSSCAILFAKPAKTSGNQRNQQDLGRYCPKGRQGRRGHQGHEEPRGAQRTGHLYKREKKFLPRKKLSNAVNLF